jgi:hypothetical protein
MTIIRTPTQEPAENNASTVLRYKGKAIPLQAWIGLESSRRLRLPDFKTIST